MSKELTLPPIPFTRFMDMHSGGGCKTDYTHIYIQAPEEQAMAIFEERFGQNPNNVTCDCCGSDYSISESPTLEQASGYDRGCKWSKEERGYIEEQEDKYTWNKYKTVEEYISQDDVLVIYANGIEQ